MLWIGTSAGKKAPWYLRGNRLRQIFFLEPFPFRVYSAGVVLTLAIPAVSTGTSATTLKSPLVPMGSAHGHTGHVRFLTAIELPEGFDVRFPPTTNDSAGDLNRNKASDVKVSMEILYPPEFLFFFPQVTSRRVGAPLTGTSTGGILDAAEPRPTSLQKPTTWWYPAETVTRTFGWPTAVKLLGETTAQTISCCGGSETPGPDLTNQKPEALKRKMSHKLVSFHPTGLLVLLSSLSLCASRDCQIGTGLVVSFEPLWL